ncbi:MAG: hypothetical protein LKE54_04405 [Prevotella sp.]|jgi:hypothetical protein|nr:hypothetical protein [Prevotella sp.]MCH3994284.1 hypothetical protein [Prevotella sp.]
MKYYLIPAKLADALNIKEFRKGNDEKGYIVTQGDLAVVGVDNAITDGAKEVTAREAKTIINSIQS